ncbi:MAG: CRISPR-associated endoribonuclease Cas6 [Chlorobi bacterium]|nr:CRISPR-associated endoribonuclease Cas6 [Chlorobiota bacterium]
MRIIITFSPLKDSICLPINHQEIIQGLIYQHLDPGIAEFLHNEGFAYKKRKFKLFTFSRLMGKVRRKGNTFTFQGNIKLVVSSIHLPTVKSLATNLIKQEEIQIGTNKVQIKSIEVEKEPAFNKEVIIRMLSPVTVYSTLSSPGGKKKTYFYNPYEREFEELIAQNIIHKFLAYYGIHPQEQTIAIEPLNVSIKNQKLIKYKATIIKGWMGKYKLSGSPELLKIAYYTGIGSKNSQGFGCFEIINMNE